MTATLGVLAGLLAAAAPAGAQFWEGTSLRTQAPRTTSVSGQEMTDALHSTNSPASPTSQVFTAVSNATGTQISEGVKAPTGVVTDGGQRPAAVLDAHMEI